VAVLRPEPGNAATCARLTAAGMTPVALPLFAVRPLAWEAPEPGFDALLLTSANALRHGGPGLDRYRSLPVLAVGEATAAAARARGFTVAETGAADAAALLATTRARRILHLGGRERAGADARVTSVAVYASEVLPDPPLAELGGTVALLHSARAARRLAELLAPDVRATVALAALSPAVAEAAGGGWRSVDPATRPTDAALVTLAGRLTGAAAAGIVAHR
jgi:uroporphyrinogen-III synthase